MGANEICEVLGLPRSNVSNVPNEQQSLGMVKSQRKLGDRRDHFTSNHDMFDLTTTVIENRCQREYLPTLQTMEAVQREAEEDVTPTDVKRRIKESLNTMQMFDSWYQDVSRLPHSIQMAMIKLGGRVARFLPNGEGS